MNAHHVVDKHRLADRGVVELDAVAQRRAGKASFVQAKADRRRIVVHRIARIGVARVRELARHAPQARRGDDHAANHVRPGKDDLAVGRVAAHATSVNRQDAPLDLRRVMEGVAENQRLVGVRVERHRPFERERRVDRVDVRRAGRVVRVGADGAVEDGQAVRGRRGVAREREARLSRRRAEGHAREHRVRIHRRARARRREGRTQRAERQVACGRQRRIPVPGRRKRLRDGPRPVHRFPVAHHDRDAGHGRARERRQTVRRQVPGRERLSAERDGLRVDEAPLRQLERRAGRDLNVLERLDKGIERRRRGVERAAHHEVRHVRQRRLRVGGGVHAACP